MARPISSRRVPLTDIGEASIPMLKVDDKPFWVQPRGIDSVHRISRIPDDFCIDMENMVLDDGSLRSRFGTQRFSITAIDIMALVSFTSPAGVGYLLRTTLTDLERWDGTAWISIASGIFSGSATDYFSFASFGSRILMTNGVNPVYSFDVDTGESEFLGGSSPAKHIAIFGNRVVLSNTVEGPVRAYRIKWTVKNDATDWQGEGSGFEDLFGAPGGLIDDAQGVFPVTEDTALAVRQNSVWQMSITGSVQAPFRFSRVYSEYGSKARRSIVAIPGGVVMLTHDDILVVTPSSVEPIGRTVYKTIINSITNFDSPQGIFDADRKEYRLYIGNTVYRYNFNDKGWTKDVYPFTIRDITLIDLDNFGLTIGELTGTIGDLTGTIGELVNPGGPIKGVFFVGEQ